MYRNGVRTGVAAIAVAARRIQQALLSVLAERSVVVVGTSIRMTAVCRTVTSTCLATGATTTVSALPYSFSITNIDIVADFV